jgi:hypothetical protein
MHYVQYVRPLFRELLRTTFGRQPALDLFASHGKSYHPICYKMTAVDIEKEVAKAPIDPAGRRKVGGSLVSLFSACTLSHYSVD